MIRSVSPLPYNQGSPWCVQSHQSGQCHLRLTSYSWSTDLVKFMPIFFLLGQFLYYHTTFKCTLAIVGPYIDHGGHMSVRHVSPDLDLIFTVFNDFVKFTLSYHDYIVHVGQILYYIVHVPWYIQHRIPIVGPHIDHGGCVFIFVIMSPYLNFI